MEWLTNMRVEHLALLVGAVAIVMGCVVSITKLVIKHRERMAMIEQGMHPDKKKGE